MATKTLGNKKNNRYVWEKGNIIVHAKKGKKPKKKK